MADVSAGRAAEDGRDAAGTGLAAAIRGCDGGATIRSNLIDVAARTARYGRGHITLHLPGACHREHEWMTLLTAACGPPGQGPYQPDPVTAPSPSPSRPYGPSSSSPEPGNQDMPQDE